MSGHKTIFRRILLLVISVIFGLQLYLWNAKTIVGNTLPMPFGYGASVVLSGSMEPVLSVNDLVFIKQTGDIKVGDVIVYESDGLLIIHRVIELNGSTIVTQGDANNVADEPITISSVKGKMIGSLPKLGGLVRMLKTPVGIILFIVAAVLLVELSYRSEQRNDDRALEELREEIRKLKEEQKDDKGEEK